MSLLTELVDGKVLKPRLETVRNWLKARIARDYPVPPAAVNNPEYQCLLADLADVEAALELLRE